MDYINKNYYEILGVDKDASIETIERARNILKYGSSDVRVPFDMYKIIDEAYDTLSSSELRKEYDKLLENNLNEIDNDIKIYTPKNSDELEKKSELDIQKDNISSKTLERLDKIAGLKKLEDDYNKSINKIRKMYDSEIDEVMINGISKDSSNITEKIEIYNTELEKAINLSNEIEKICKEININTEIKNIDDIIQELHKKLKQEIINLKTSKEKYMQILDQIYRKEDFNEKDSECKKLLFMASKYYNNIETLSNKLGVKVDVVSCDEFLSKSKSKEKPKAKLPANVITIPDENKKQLDLLLKKYQMELSHIISIHSKNLKVEEDEWKKLLQNAYRAYDELIDFCQKNGKNLNIKTVDEILAERNIPKDIPKIPEQKPSPTKLIDLTKENNGESYKLNPNIFESTKYTQSNKVSANNYETIKEMNELNKKWSRIKLTALGGGLGFMLLISPIGGFGVVTSIIGSILSGKLTNVITKKLQESKLKFSLTKESYTGVVTEVNTTESRLVRQSNEKLRKKLEDLAKHPNSDFELEVQKLKYQNQIKLLDQMIMVRKNAKSKMGQITAQSLRISALKQEKIRAKSDLNRINKLIARDNLEKKIDDEGLKLDYNSSRYSNLTIGNMLLKKDIRKKLKLQKEQGKIGERSTKTR